MSDALLIDHLFRHEYGKIVAVLTRVFGLSNLERVEDAVQDTFARALLAWRHQTPDNPQGWLMRAARNRVVDLLREESARSRSHNAMEVPPQSEVEGIWLEGEIKDAQLRMIFTACHPALQPTDQMAFALKAISGFSQKEIAAALLLKEETVKKRLQRARKTIREASIDFAIPHGQALVPRVYRVLDVLYLIFNEGFHSTQPTAVVRRDLCGEAIRLVRMLLEHPPIRNGRAYALLAVFCFHAARLESKTAADGHIIDLPNQDRALWYAPLVQLGFQSLGKALDWNERSAFVFEAAIAAEHHKAASYESTDWQAIRSLNEGLLEHHPSDLVRLNLAVVCLKCDGPDAAKQHLEAVDPAALEQRRYLYHGTWAEYWEACGSPEKAIGALEQALACVSNESERAFLEERKARLATRRC